MWKSKRTTVSYLKNVNTLCIAIMVLLSCVLTGYAQEQAVSRKVVEVNPKIYEGYIGQYQLSPQFVITISKEKNSLFAQATGQAKIEIFPESETKFFYKVVDAQITFVQDDKGTVTNLILYQNGLVIPGKKISDTVAGERKAIEINSKILETYIGNYQIAPGFILTITQEDSSVFAQATGQAKLEIFPESETKFFFKAVDAQITFVNDDDGTVKELILHQGGDHHAKRIE